MRASEFLAQVESERTRRPGSGQRARQFAVYPPGSYVYLGCRAYEPKFDATAYGQDRDKKSHRYGRWKFRSKRGRKPDCICGQGKGRIVQRGTLWTCEACSESGQDHLLPTVARPPEHKADESPRPKAKLTRRQARRAKVAGLHGASVPAVP